MRTDWNTDLYDEEEREKDHFAGGERVMESGLQVFNHMKQLALAAGIMLGVLLGILCICGFKNADSTPSGKDLRYQSVRIERGDTLWSLSQEYYDTSFASLKDYIKEVKRINNLTSETIHEGGYLLMPYTVQSYETAEHTPKYNGEVVCSDKNAVEDTKAR